MLGIHVYTVYCIKNPSHYTCNPSQYTCTSILYKESKSFKIKLSIIHYIYICILLFLHPDEISTDPEKF